MMNDEDRPDLPLALRAATAVGLAAAVLGTTSLAWMADASLTPDAAAADRAVRAAADPVTTRELVATLRQAIGSVR